ncbi:hypothetical protein M501DRAFT_991436 [Patellaria atrata CBS 101060]|uniref:Uncharacterized protein n=1 Tax=Patellaria atrata CBS 101060 TaxID=1346257 RepID=A0A9P4SD79_9PEZI|nr:hypothetical protein M501DRAFT_991436 [Patellaria atrata CBS 101060]
MLFQRTNLSKPSSPPQGVQFAKFSAEALTAIRKLSPDKFLVLFTPFLPAWPQLSGNPQSTAPSTNDLSQRKYMDPFEPLGRALSLHHASVRHVPYVPDVGILDIHVSFLRSAGAAIVLVAGDELEDEGVMEQWDFAYDVLDAVEGCVDVPVVAVQIGHEFGSAREQEAILQGFDTVLRCPYDALVGDRGVAQRIFGV